MFEKVAAEEVEESFELGDSIPLPSAYMQWNQPGI